MQPNNDNSPFGQPPKPPENQTPSTGPSASTWDPEKQAEVEKPKDSGLLGTWNEESSFYGTTPTVAPQEPQQLQANVPVPPPPMLQAPVVMTLPLWIKDHKKILSIGIFAAIIVITIALQIIYPSSRLLPGTVIDGVDVSMMRKPDAVKKINEAYGEIKLDIYFGDNDASFFSPKYKDVGIGIDATERVAPHDYPWYWRLVPTSFFWAADFNESGALAYVYDKAKIDKYIELTVGDDCAIAPRDATLKLVDDKLQVVSARSGGTCDITEFQQALQTTEPVALEVNQVKIAMVEKAAYVNDDKARLLGKQLNDRASTPMPIMVNGKQQTIAGRSVLSWLDFKSYIPETPEGQVPDEDRIRTGSRLTFYVDRERMNVFMEGGVGQDVAVKAGVNKVSTLDSAETSRVNAAPGRKLDVERTAVTVENYLNSNVDKATAETQPVPADTDYVRTYTPTNAGFAALLAQWDHDNEGEWAVSYKEIGGFQPYRSASHRADVPMPAAGLEAGFVGYAVVMGEANNTILSNDVISNGREPYQCFMDMYERTDLDCIEGFFLKIGFETMTARGKELGLRHTTFGAKDTKTSTSDLEEFLYQARLSKIAPQNNGGRIMSAMQGTRLDDGIEAGLIKGTLVNIAGENGDVHNDAAIVYSPKGTYILVIMTKGATGREAIADLTARIEELHAIPQPGQYQSKNLTYTKN